VGATLFSSPRIEAGGGDQAKVNDTGSKVVGFTDDRLDCQTMPIEKYTYAGKKFTEVFSAAQQATLKKAFPTGVCDYSKPGKGFQAAVTWLRYQDSAGGVVYGGTAMGAAPLSVYFRGSGSAAAGDATAPVEAVGSLPTTGLPSDVALIAAVLLAAAVAVRRVRLPGHVD
jgi:hypothetical protein